MVKFELLIKCGSGSKCNSKVCNELIKFIHSYTFITRLYINSLQIFELHLQPLPRFIDDTNFTIKRPTSLCNFKNFNIL